MFGRDAVRSTWMAPHRGKRRGGSNACRMESSSPTSSAASPFVDTVRLTLPQWLPGCDDEAIPFAADATVSGERTKAAWMALGKLLG